ncbi:MAG: hypothetical protein KDD69_19750 [Bdellovibrionales bacterium]|nr:hypothetical protein [Bdellovibrionales bacterium]
MVRKQLQGLLTDRSAIDSIVVTRDTLLLAKMRQVLAELGFCRVGGAPNHIAALDRLTGRSYRLVFFDAAPTNMPTEHFVRQAARIAPEAVLVALSGDPSIDDVFTMLRHGARAFVRLPMSVAQVEQVLFRAVEAPPFNDTILQAADRDRALATMVLNNLFRLSEIMREVRTHPHLSFDESRKRASFHESVYLARTFSQGGDLVLRERICDECCVRSERPSTRLGRVRIRLRQAREEMAA